MKIDLFNLICWLVMLGSLTSYLVASSIYGRTDQSISASFFRWPSWKRIWFILGLWGVAIPVLVMESRVDYDLLSTVSSIGHYGMVASSVLLMIVGIFADFRRSKIEEWFHVGASFGCILLGLLSIAFLGSPKIIAAAPILLFIVISAIFRLEEVRNLTRWDEINAYIWLLVGVFMFYVL